jgi:hypothetical protein
VPAIVSVDAVCCITRSMVTGEGVGGWYGTWPLDEHAAGKRPGTLLVLLGAFDLWSRRVMAPDGVRNTRGVTCEVRVPASEGHGHASRSNAAL